MQYERFTDYNPKKEAQAVIAQADAIIRDYSGQGYTLTLRQLYYQFVSKDLIPNNDRSYKRLGEIVSQARLAGMLPWDGIEDRGREMKSWLIEEDIDNILADLPSNYAADYWADQAFYVEVWVEKDALASVVRRACMPLRVGYMACKGYLSASEAYRAGKRMERAMYDGKTPIVIHLGDHDPSGIDMTRDNGDRLELLSGDFVEVRRIALNRDQIDEYAPPPNPAKITDSRAADYIREHGNLSWELDALEPSVIVDLITREIEPLIIDEHWERARRREQENRRTLRQLRHRWDDVEAMLRNDSE